jgi:hypothetical protein
MEACGSPQSSPVLRWLSGATKPLARYPAGLRVVCVVAEYIGDDGTCRISQTYVAKRLGISRQATNKHFGLLDRLNILPAKFERVGLPKSYSLPGATNGD